MLPRLPQVLAEGTGRSPSPYPLANVTDPATGGEGSAALCLDRLHELQLAVLDVVKTVGGQRGVAVLVDVVRTENAVTALRVLEQLRPDGLTVVGLVASGLERVEGQLHGLVAVDGVRVRLVHAVLRLEVLEELRGFLDALLLELLRAERRDRHLGAGADVRRDAAFLRVGERRLGDAVRSVELARRACRRHVLEHLDVVLAGHARADEAVGLDLRRKRAVVRGVLVRSIVALNGQTDILRRALDVLRETRAVGGLVVEDVDGLAAVLLHDGRQGRALDRVRRDDARVRALLGRVVLVRLAGLRARIVRGQSDVGVRRADLRDVRLVQDRQRDLRTTGVAPTEVEDRS